MADANLGNRLVPLSSKLAFGVGQFAEGLKNTGFAFLILFQAVGAEPTERFDERTRIVAYRQFFDHSRPGFHDPWRDDTGDPSAPVPTRNDKVILRTPGCT